MLSENRVQRLSEKVVGARSSGARSVKGAPVIDHKHGSSPCPLNSVLLQNGGEVIGKADRQEIARSNLEPSQTIARVQNGITVRVGLR